MWGEECSFDLFSLFLSFLINFHFTLVFLPFFKCMCVLVFVFIYLFCTRICVAASCSLDAIRKESPEIVRALTFQTLSGVAKRLRHIIWLFSR